MLMTAPRWPLLAAAALLIIPATAAATTLTSHRAVVPPCPPGMTCITGKLLIRDPGSDTVNQILVEDKNGAPMAWVNVYGLYSGGNGWKDQGGLICVTYGVAFDVACLTPAGTLELRPTDPGGATGPMETLTAQDIASLHQLRRAGLTARDLAVLVAWAHAREARR